MNTITLNNYEAFLLDYMEGNLDEAAKHELKAFVINHPELAIDLDDLDLPKIGEESIEFDFKAQLKKTEPAISSETLFDYLENNLPQAEREHIESNFLKNKALEFDFNLLKKTVLPVDNSERIPDKNSLYKTETDLLLKEKVVVYFEGQLDPDQKNTFETELKTNTALQKELALYTKTKLVPDLSVAFSNKDDLKKWALSYYEGLLSGQEKIAFERELETNRHLQKELALYQKTRLIADASVVYPHKEDLKKQIRIVALFSFRNVTAMAAAILLLLGFFVVFKYSNQDNVRVQPELAKLTKEDASPKKQSHIPATKNQLQKPITNQVQEEGLASALKPKLEVKASPVDSSEKIRQNSPIIKNEEQGIVFDQPKKDNSVKGEISIAHNQNHSRPDNDLLNDTSSAPVGQEKYTVLLAVEDNDENTGQLPEKKGFWNRAVKLAQGANKLGVKAIDGAETSRQKFSLSFNAFSVEKH